MDDLPDLPPGRKMAIYGDSIDPTDTTPIEKEPSKEPAVRVKLFAMLRNVEALKNLDDDLTNDLVDFCRLRTFKADEVVFNQGDPGDAFYMVEKGNFECRQRDDKGNEKSVHTYHDSGTFGEVALYYMFPRIASIIARSEGAQLWELPRIKYRTHAARVSYQRGLFLEEIVKKIPMFSRLTEDEIIKFTDAMRPYRFKKDETLFQQGDPATDFFVVEKGTLESTMRCGEKLKCVARYKRGDFFGEQALVSREPQTCTVTATSDSVVAKVASKTFDPLMGPCLDWYKAERIRKQGIADSEQMTATVRELRRTEARDSPAP